MSEMIQYIRHITTYLQSLFAKIASKKTCFLPSLGRGWGWGLVFISFFASCTSDLNEQDVLEQNASLRVMRATRAVTGIEDNGDIKIFLTNGTDKTEGWFKYADGPEWSTQLKLKSGTRRYHLYGFMPAISGLTTNLTSWTNTTGNLRIQGLDALTTRDYCVITGVKRVENETDERSAERGQLSFEYASSRMNYLNLLFDHLFGRVTFKMKIGADYSTLRTIKIKHMELQVPGYSKVTADIKLTDDLGIDKIDYTVTGTDNSTLNIKDTELTLTTTAVNVASAQFAAIPGLVNNIKLYTEYDVFDKEGNKIAERTATNQLTTVLRDITAGEERLLTITVDPSFLYILSDADLDNPPFVIE